MNHMLAVWLLNMMNVYNEVSIIYNPRISLYSEAKRTHDMNSFKKCLVVCHSLCRLPKSLLILEDKFCYAIQYTIQKLFAGRLLTKSQKRAIMLRLQVK